MLKHGINFIIVFIFTTCSSKSGVDKTKPTSIAVVGQEIYTHIIKAMNDSVNAWKLNGLRDYLEVKSESEYQVDSLICFNQNGTRAITCLIGRTYIKPNPTGGITYFYGEKINNDWYFFSGPNIFIPYEMKETKDGNPFTFEELHKISLKQVYSSYLKNNGEINETWFTSHFEGIGYGDFNDQASSDKYLNLNGKRFTNKREFFEAIHLQGVRNNWFGVKKDSIKALP